MKRRRHVLSISFGKDSLAMLLYVLENGLPLDEVVFFNTSMEFECIYRIRDRVIIMLRERGIPFREIMIDKPFTWYMFEKEVKERDTGAIHYGYSWCGGSCRWCTTLKLNALEKYCCGCIEYVGLAADETERIEKERNGFKEFPLADAGMTEKDCLKYCHDRGFYWMEEGIELYDILDRVSCFCCANKNLKELKNIWYYLPKYWERLKELQAKTTWPMKGESGSVFELEKRFMREGHQVNLYDVATTFGITMSVC